MYIFCQFSLKMVQFLGQNDAIGKNLRVGTCTKIVSNGLSVCNASENSWFEPGIGSNGVPNDIFYTKFDLWGILTRNIEKRSQIHIMAIWIPLMT